MYRGARVIRPMLVGLVVLAALSGMAQAQILQSRYYRNPGTPGVDIGASVSMNGSGLMATHH